MDRRQPVASHRKPHAWAAALAFSALTGAVLAVALALPETGGRRLLLIGLAFTLLSMLSLVAAWRQDRDMARQLTARDAMLNAAFLSTPALTLSRDGLIQRMNGAAVALFGLPREAALGRAFSDLTAEFDMDAVHQTHAQAGQLEARRGYWTGRRADGSTFPLSLRFGLIPATPGPGGSGVEHVAVALTDLTHSHAAEAQARELHAQLNKVWRLNSLGEMAATLAHELNQPLSAATAYMHASQAEMLKAGAAAEAARPPLDLAKGQLLRAGKLIHRMRELLTIETSVLGRERVSSMVEDLAPILQMIGQDKQVEVRLDAKAENDGVCADRIQFQQALVNLVRNAVEAAAERPGGGGLVQLVGRVEGPVYRISVEDNGAGIAEADAERIFQPLTTTKSGGMGLGLSVTRTIVERHGGALSAQRSPSLGGAAFAFALRRHEEGSR
ncbi:MAG TPA: PAS domain-containing sensor histidine kinase [Brevundimonas sp.]